MYAHFSRFSRSSGNPVNAMGFENHGNRNSFFVNHILKLLTVCTDSGWEKPH